MFGVGGEWVVPLIPADLLRALGLVLIPAAWVTAGWPSAAVIFLVFGTQWLLRWLRGGSLLDWAGQLTLLAAGWFSVTGLYHRVGALDVLMHALTSALVAGLVGIAVEAALRRRDIPAATVLRTTGRTLAWLGLAGATVGLGVVWELAEWWGHTFVTEEIGVGYEDTIGDLAANTLGALVGAWLAVRTGERG